MADYSLIYYDLNTALKRHMKLNYIKISSAIRNFTKIKLFNDIHKEKKLCISLNQVLVKNSFYNFQSSSCQGSGLCTVNLNTHI